MIIINGKEIAERVYEELAQVRESIARPIKLGIVVGTQDAVIESFVRIKARAATRLGVEMVRVDLPAGEAGLAPGATTTDAIAAVRDLADRTDGVIVQLPLPAQIDTDAVLAAVPREKDVDALNPIPEDKKIVHAPVALAVEEILKTTHVEITGKRAVIVGAGRLVGAPTAWLLKQLGAEVSLVTTQGGTLDDLKTADIAVLGAGNPGFVKPDMIKDGIVLIDAGTSEAGGKIAGDADPACAQIASVFTPVPGGVGPIAVAMIFKNLFTLMQHKEKTA